jgi:hypothetical protein
MHFSLTRWIRAGSVLILATTLLASCSSLRKPAPPPNRPEPTPPPSSSAPVSPAPPVVTAPAPSAPPPTSSRPTPIPAQVISLNGSCSQRETDGFREQATLQVDKDEVRELNWQLWVGNRGSCTFTGSEFTQTQKTPHIELRAKDGSGCRLIIYQDKRWITLAHAACQKRCTGDIYDEAWPVMFDRSGKCGKIG